MKKTLSAISCALVLVVSACADGGSTFDDETTTTVVPSSETTTTTVGTDVTETTLAGQSISMTFDELMSKIDDAHEVSSARIEGSVTLTGMEAGFGGPSDGSIAFSTSFDTAAETSAFVIDLSSMAGAMDSDPDDPFGGFAEAFVGPMEFRKVGDRVYMKVALFQLMLGSSTEWVSAPAEDRGEFTSGFETVPSHPKDVVGAYDGAEATVEDLGRQAVNGADTTHYRVTFDTEKLAATLSAEERADLEESGIFAVGVVPMDLWISDDGHLVRLHLELDGASIEAASGESFETMTIRYDMYDLNQPVSIIAPPSSEVTPIEDLDMDFGFDVSTFDT